MSARNKHQTKLLTISAMLSALGVVVLAIGSVFQTLDLTTAALAAFFCIYAVIEIGGAYPWMVWGVTSFLGLLLLPQKSPAVFFLFIGCYPILKEKLERLSKALCLALKLAIFHAMAGLFLLTMRIFFPEELLFSLSWMLLGSYILAVVTFVVYDYALSKVITLYLFRLRDQFRLRLKK
jgi:hypothetical protein